MASATITPAVGRSGSLSMGMTGAGVSRRPFRYAILGAIRPPEPQATGPRKGEQPDEPEQRKLTGRRRKRGPRLGQRAFLDDACRRRRRRFRLCGHGYLLAA